MPKILHFADAHIDMINYGRHDPGSGLPARVMDFLKSLDTIIQSAIDEHVDLVIFAGDAYRDRNPSPTFQREWGKRIMRLAQARIPTVLLVGNHDLAPALGRAHAMEAFDTLQVPFVHVIEKPAFLGPQDLDGVPLQLMALPWAPRSSFLARQGNLPGDMEQVYEDLSELIHLLIGKWFESRVDPSLPLLMAAHCSIQGAVYGGERSVMLGRDLVLPRSLVCDPRLDYVALGHIHKAQDLNEGSHPPVIYPGSIERVDWGEAGDDKYFIIAQVERGRSQVEWRILQGIRRFVDRAVNLESNGAPPADITSRLLSALPEPAKLQDAIVRLTIDYPKEWEALIDEASLREYAEASFDFQVVRRPRMESRIRLPGDQAIGSLAPLELLDLYWQANHTAPEDAQRLNQLADALIRQQPE